MKIILFAILFFVTGFSCVTFVLDAGLSHCMNRCKLQNQIVKDFGWKDRGKIYCECKDKEK